jgi:hypothetical protein
VESAGGERAWAVAPSGDSFFIVLVIILDEEEDDGSHEGSEADLNCGFDFGFDDFGSGTDLDLVFLVNLSDCDWPVFYSCGLLKETRNRNRQEHTLLTTPCLVSRVTLILSDDAVALAVRASLTMFSFLFFLTTV